MASNDEDQAAKCPFAKIGGPNPHAIAEEEKKGESSMKEEKKEVNNSKVERCPWPFVFFHDAKTGIRDWQTWAVIGLVLCWAWSKVQKKMES